MSENIHTDPLNDAVAAVLNETKTTKKPARQISEAKTTIQSAIRLLSTAIGKNSGKPEFGKAAQALEDWGNAHPGQWKRLGSVPTWGAFLEDLEQVLDIRVGDGMTFEDTTAEGN